MRRVGVRGSGWVFALACALAASAVSCTGERPQSGLATAVLRSGGVEVRVELALTQEERQTGLMHRTKLPDGTGMLFVWNSDQRMSFWMKNTLVPLSIAFIASDGTIREIHDMEPLSESVVRSERYARYALEVPKGWFERVGLEPGDRFELPQDLSAEP